MNTLFNTSAGLLNECVLKIPNRRFIPDILVQTVTSGKNLQIMGCKTAQIQGSSIATNYEQSLKGSLGEFVERYSSGTYDNRQFIVGSFKELSKRYTILPLENFRYYSDQQYELLKQKNIYPLSEIDTIEWVEGYDCISQQPYLIPAFSVYMPYVSKVPSPHNYMSGATSTGIAAGPTLKQAVVSGFCECAERHAFSQFWYRQDDITYHQYTAQLILQQYHKVKIIRQLFDNRFVSFKVFDLSSFAPLETMVVFLYFQYKGFMYQSLGCAARFSKVAALTKACLEAYQGVEYALNLMEKKILPDLMDLTLITNFDAHFHFYNKYPEYRNRSRILREAQDFDHGDKEIYHKKEENCCRDFNEKELIKTGLKHVIFKDITPTDIEDISYKVARVITPTWSLLTGCHAWPFLGFSLNGKDCLFTDYPHPFP